MPSPVVITDFFNQTPDVERDILGGQADVVCLNAFSEPELEGRVEDAPAVIVYHSIPFGAQTIARLKNCKLIVRAGVGFDNVDIKAAAARGIPVANVPDYGTEEVADSAIGLMLSLTRGINRLNLHLRRDGSDWSHGPAAPLYRLRGRTFGVLGLGRIGTAAALRAKALGMRVLFYDPYRTPGTEKALGLERAWTLEDLLRQSHVISAHCPLTPETHHILNSETLSLLPRGSFLVNTARGAVVRHHDIPDLIASGQLAGAGIYVLPFEPPQPGDPLIAAWQDVTHPAHDRVIINSHCAFYSEEGMHEIRVKSADACRRALAGLPILNVVNGVTP